MDGPERRKKMRKILCFGLFLGITATVAGQQPPPPGPDHGPPPGLPMVADSNGDREIDSSEWEAFLMALQPDETGLLDPETFHSYMQSHKPDGPDGERPGERRRPPPPERGRGGEGGPPFPDWDHNGVFHIDDLNKIFHEMDGNGDGILQMEEWPPPPRRPKR